MIIIDPHYDLGVSGSKLNLAVWAWLRGLMEVLGLLGCGQCQGLAGWGLSLLRDFGKARPNPGSLIYIYITIYLLDNRL